MEVVLVQPASKGGMKFIRMRLEGDRVSREWGLVGGKTQSTSNVYKALNVGKANEKSPKQVAEEDFDRIRTKKVEEGYKEIVDNDWSGLTRAALREDYSDQLDTLDFDNPPTSFAASKPISKISDSALDKLIKSGNALVQNKENGLCHWVFVGDKGIRIFTRRMDDHTAKYPELVRAFEALPGVGPGSLFAVELVIKPTGKGHLADFKLVCGIGRADTVKGELKFEGGVLPKTQERKEANPVRACVFHCLYLNGDPLWEKPYREAWVVLSQLPPKEQGMVLFRPDTLTFTSAEQVRQSLRKNRGLTEGYVVWDLSAPIELSFTGKPKRRAAYKAKAVQETDVVVISVEAGKGKRQGKVAALTIGAYDEDGQFFAMGKCGSGLTDESAEPSFWADLPCVVQIEYAEQFETGKYQFPVFIAKHGDKDPKEVTVRREDFE